MPGSNQSSNGQVPGLSMFAFVLFDVAGGIVKSSGIASVNKQAVGQFAIVFSQVQASLNYIVMGNAKNANAYGLPLNFEASSRTAAGCTVATRDGGNGQADVYQSGYVAFYL